MVRFAPLLIIPILAFGDEVQRPDPREIIGGTRTDSREFPTALYVGGCSGSLIAETWALTAAHCVVGKSLSRMKVERGYPEDFESRRVVYTVVHPEYVRDPNWTKNDVALVQFSRPLSSSTVQIQKLADDSLSEILLQPGTMTTSLGFGQINRAGDPSDGLWTAQWPVAPCPSVEEFDGYVVTDRDICRKNTPWESQIHIGDSGGPVLVLHQDEWWQVGLITYNANAIIDGRWQYYSISHKVAPYLEWIWETIDSIPSKAHTSIDDDFLDLQQRANELADRSRELTNEAVDLIYAIQDLRGKVRDSDAE